MLFLCCYLESFLFQLLSSFPWGNDFLNLILLTASLTRNVSIIMSILHEVLKRK